MKKIYVKFIIVLAAVVTLTSCFSTISISSLSSSMTIENDEITIESILESNKNISMISDSIPTYEGVPLPSGGGDNGTNISSLAYAAAFIKQLIDSPTLYTTDGSSFTAYCYTDWTESDGEAFQTEVVEPAYSSLTEEYVLDYPTFKYNCHSYAWYNSSVDNEYVIEYTQDVLKFINDIHTHEIVNQYDLQPNDIVTYWQIIGINQYGEAVLGECLHSAIIDQIDADGSIVCVSKWGEWGLYIHNLQYVPTSYANKVQDEYGNIDYLIYPIYYRYIQDEHDLYMYEDNDEDGCIVKCSASKLGDDGFEVVCPHSIICDEDPSYGATSSGHYASCLNGHFSFFEEHTDGESEYYDLYYHNTSCEFCGYRYIKPHNWVTYGTKYRCLDCGRISNQAPSIMQNVPPIDETTEVEIPIVEGEETVAALPPVNDNQDYIE